MNLSIKPLLTACIVIAAAACSIHAATTLGTEHSMRSLLFFILACTVIVCAFIGLAYTVIGARVDDFLAKQAAKEAYSATVAYASSVSCGANESREEPATRRRRELEQMLVNGASHTLAGCPNDARSLAKGIKDFLDELESKGACGCRHKEACANCPGSPSA